ncbi:MAG: UDP-N-acetylglucosamine 2-epimerase [Paracoccaceae bacterium]
MGKLPSSHFKQIPSMRFSYFSTLLKNSQIIIGNSSVGVREAPFLGVPSINIGSRQFRRAEAKSIKNVDVFKNKNLDRLVESLWGKRFPTDNSFGTGQSAKKFTKILKDKKIWKLNLQKAFFETSTK